MNLLKKIGFIFLFTVMTIATLSQDIDSTGRNKSSSSTAIWIALGVVLFVVLIAAKNRKKKQ